MPVQKPRHSLGSGEGNRMGSTVQRSQVSTSSSRARSIDGTRRETASGASGRTSSIGPNRGLSSASHRQLQTDLFNEGSLYERNEGRPSSSRRVVISKEDKLWGDIAALTSKLNRIQNHPDRNRSVLHQSQRNPPQSSGKQFGELLQSLGKSVPSEINRDHERISRDLSFSNTPLQNTIGRFSAHLSDFGSDASEDAEAGEQSMHVAVAELAKAEVQRQLAALGLKSITNKNPQTAGSVLLDSQPVPQLPALSEFQFPASGSVFSSPVLSSANSNSVKRVDQKSGGLNKVTPPIKSSGIQSHSQSSSSKKSPPSSEKSLMGKSLSFKDLKSPEVLLGRALSADFSPVPHTSNQNRNSKLPSYGLSGQTPPLNQNMSMLSPIQQLNTPFVEEKSRKFSTQSSDQFIRTEYVHDAAADLSPPHSLPIVGHSNLTQNSNPVVVSRRRAPMASPISEGSSIPSSMNTSSSEESPRDVFVAAVPASTASVPDLQLKTPPKGPNAVAKKEEEVDESLLSPTERGRLLLQRTLAGQLPIAPSTTAAVSASAVIPPAQKLIESELSNINRLKDDVAEMKTMLSNVFSMLSLREKGSNSVSSEIPSTSSFLPNVGSPIASTVEKVDFKISPLKPEDADNASNEVSTSAAVPVAPESGDGSNGPNSGSVGDNVTTEPVEPVQEFNAIVTCDFGDANAQDEQMAAFEGEPLLATSVQGQGWVLCRRKLAGTRLFAAFLRSKAAGRTNLTENRLIEPAFQRKEGFVPLSHVYIEPEPIAASTSLAAAPVTPKNGSKSKVETIELTSPSSVRPSSSSNTLAPLFSPTSKEGALLKSPVRKAPPTTNTTTFSNAVVPQSTLRQASNIFDASVSLKGSIVRPSLYSASYDSPSASNTLRSASSRSFSELSTGLNERHFMNQVVSEAVLSGGLVPSEALRSSSEALSQWELQRQRFHRLSDAALALERSLPASNSASVHTNNTSVIGSTSTQDSDGLGSLLQATSPLRPSTLNISSVRTATHTPGGISVGIGTMAARSIRSELLAPFQHGTSQGLPSRGLQQQPETKRTSLLPPVSMRKPTVSEILASVDVVSVSDVLAPFHKRLDSSSVFSGAPNTVSSVSNGASVVDMEEEFLRNERISGTPVEPPSTTKIKKNVVFAPTEPLELEMTTPKSKTLRKALSSPAIKSSVTGSSSKTTTPKSIDLSALKKPKSPSTSNASPKLSPRPSSVKKSTVQELGDADSQRNQNKTGKNVLTVDLSLISDSSEDESPSKSLQTSPSANRSDSSGVLLKSPSTASTTPVVKSISLDGVNESDTSSSDSSSSSSSSSSSESESESEAELKEGGEKPSSTTTSPRQLHSMSTPALQTRPSPLKDEGEDLLARARRMLGESERSLSFVKEGGSLKSPVIPRSKSEAVLRSPSDSAASLSTEKSPGEQRTKSPDYMRTLQRARALLFGSASSPISSAPSASPPPPPPPSEPVEDDDTSDNSEDNITYSPVDRNNIADSDEESVPPPPSESPSARKAQQSHASKTRLQPRPPQRPPPNTRSLNVAAPPTRPVHFTSTSVDDESGSDNGDHDNEDDQGDQGDEEYEGEDVDEEERETIHSNQYQPYRYGREKEENRMAQQNAHDMLSSTQTRDYTSNPDRQSYFLTGFNNNYNNNNNNNNNGNYKESSQEEEIPAHFLRSHDRQISAFPLSSTSADAFGYGNLGGEVSGVGNGNTNASGDRVFGERGLSERYSRDDRSEMSSFGGEHHDKPQKKRGVFNALKSIFTGSSSSDHDRDRYRVNEDGFPREVRPNLSLSPHAQPPIQGIYTGSDAAYPHTGPNYMNPNVGGNLAYSNTNIGVPNTQNGAQNHSVLPAGFAASIISNLPTFSNDGHLQSHNNQQQPQQQQFSQSRFMEGEIIPFQSTTQVPSTTSFAARAAQARQEAYQKRINAARAAQNMALQARGPPAASAPQESSPPLSAPPERQSPSVAAGSLRSLNRSPQGVSQRVIITRPLMANPTGASTHLNGPGNPPNGLISQNNLANGSPFPGNVAQTLQFSPALIPPYTQLSQPPINVRNAPLPSGQMPVTTPLPPHMRNALPSRRINPF